MQPELTVPPVKQEQHALWDFTKATLTSLALIGFCGGCAEQSVESLIESRPEATPQEIERSDKFWVGREVTIRAVPQLVSDQSVIYFSGGKHAQLKLQLDLRYDLRTSGDGSPSHLQMIDRRDIRLSRGFYTPKEIANITAEHVLPKTTFVVSGKIEKYNDGNGLYLNYMNSMHRNAAE